MVRLVSDPQRLHPLCELIDDNSQILVVANDSIGENLARLDKLIVHWGDRFGELLANAFFASAALVHVTLQTALEAELLVALAKHFEMEAFGDLGIGKQEDAFSNDDLGRRENLEVVEAAMFCKVVDGDCDIESFGEPVELKAEEIVVE